MASGLQYAAKRRLDLSRREFLTGFSAAFGGLALPAETLCRAQPKLRFGVVSDIHISASWNQEAVLEKALRWFDAQQVDAVMVPGDITHSGLIRELTSFAKVWYKVFPSDRGADGRHVEKLFVTGNHDLEATWVRGTDAWRAENVFNHGENPRKIWRELFHEDYELIWRKVVKGYAFIGSQWPIAAARPPVEAWFRAHGTELDPLRPTFYVQHAHPLGTCGDGKISSDDGTATRALTPFANAVAITGHSHQTIVDESSAWQGAFTSLNAGCLRTGANDRKGVYDSDYPFWSPKRRLNRMKPIACESGRCGLLVDVFDNLLVVKRWAFAYDQPLGMDWVLPLPAVVGGEFDPKCQRAADRAPEFAAGARLEIIRHAVTPETIAGPALKGKASVQVRIPHAYPVRPASRVYDFDVEVRRDGQSLVRRLVLARGFNLPEALSDVWSDCLFGADEIPQGVDCALVVTPRTAFGAYGRPLFAKI